MAVGEGMKLKAQFIPPPIDGLNLISDPLSGKPTECRQLDNYFIYDWGIRERGAVTQYAMPDGGPCVAVFPFTSLSQRAVLVSSNANTYVFSGTTFSASKEAAYFTGAFAFNQKVFLPHPGGLTVGTYDLLTDGYVATSFTLPATFAAFGGCAYKNRCYFWDSSGVNAKIAYGDVDAITGAMKTFPIGSVFQNGTIPAFCSSWSYNQGINNDELFVIGNNAGEILVYSGDYPAAANWQLVTRVQLSAPLFPISLGGAFTTSALRVGQDLIINTARGAISLSQVLAGRRDEDALYSISRKLGPVLGGMFTSRSVNYPFSYFGGASGEVYVLNHERGAWSKFTSFLSAGELLVCSGSSASALSTTLPVSSDVYFGASNAGLSAGHLYKIVESATAADSTATYTWATNFLNFDSPLKKRSVHLDVLSRDMASTSVSNSVTTLADFNETVAGAAGTGTKTVSSTAYITQRLTPAQNPAQWLSYKFSKTGSASAMNEIAGFNAAYEEGGF